MAFAYLYFCRQVPHFKDLESKLKAVQNQLSAETCKEVYSQTEGKVVCLTQEELKSKALSECSKNFRENLDENMLKAIKTVSDLEKLRELAVKMCMQEKGFDY